MSSLKVLVYEDDLAAAETWADRIRDSYSGAEVEVSNSDAFQKLLERINLRRAAWREPGGAKEMLDPHKADTRDVIVVDYDLFKYSASGDTTGNKTCLSSALLYRMWVHHHSKRIRVKFL